MYGLRILAVYTARRFNTDKPKTITEDKIKVNEIKLTRFLERFGLNLDNG